MKKDKNMINPKHLNEYVVQPVLSSLGMGSEAAELLLIGTAFTESRLRELHQFGGAPAIGIYQCEPDTHEDIWENYLKYRPELAAKVSRWGNRDRALDADMMHGNLYYATAMARLVYWRSPDKLPAVTDFEGMANMHKKVYNTVHGKADPKKSKMHFQQMFECLHT